MDKFRFLGAALMAAVFMQASAIPAKKGILKYTQPDGSTVNVTLQGDESLHYYLTEDGYPLLPGSDGTLYFAKLSGARADTTGFRACNKKERTPALNRMISQQSPTGIEFEKALAAQARKSPRRYVIPQEGVGTSTTSFPRTGKVKGLVILVQYKNVKFKLDNPKEYFTNLLCQDGFSDYRGTGSAHEYFLDASNGKFDPQFDIYGPVTLPKNRSYYGATTTYSHDARPEDMVVHAIELLNPEVDFSQYDNDGDGVLDNVFLFYAGQGQNDGGPGESVWPHAWELSAVGKDFMVDGVMVSRYACSNEWQTQAGLPDGIGTFCHEFSHVMGLPDLYSTQGDGGKYTPGEWSVLDYGPYNNYSRTPPTYSAFERNAMGWLDITPITEACSVAIPELQDSNKAYMVATRTPTEFFLFENRQQTGWDEYLPGHGMLIWHIDYDRGLWDANSVNNNIRQQHVDIIEANGAGNDSDGRAWPGPTGKTSFTHETSPAFVDWYNNPIALPLTNIEEKAGIITFDVDGGDFELTPPTGIKAIETTPVSIKLSWLPVAKAKGYELDVYTKASDGNPVYLEGLHKFNVGEHNDFVVTGLEPETDYYFALAAISGSRNSGLSAEFSARTAEISFPWMSPSTLEPSEVNSDSFLARWEPMAEAVDYLLTVTSSFQVEPENNTCSFGSVSFSIPKGWTFTGNTSRYTDEEYCGNAVPAAKMSTDGVSITTRLYDYDVQSVRFWYRGERTNSMCILDIDGLVNGEWIPLDRIENPSREASTKEIINLPDGVRQVRFLYHKYGNGFMAIDDIEICVGGVARTVIDGYNGLAVGNVTQFPVTDMPSDFREYIYTVQAVDESGRKSLISEPREVVLSPLSVDGVETPANNAIPTGYYDMLGRRVETPLHGIYIVRYNDGTAKKVIF